MSSMVLGHSRHALLRMAEGWVVIVLAVIAGAYVVLTSRDSLPAMVAGLAVSLLVAGLGAWILVRQRRHHRRHFG